MPGTLTQTLTAVGLDPDMVLGSSLSWQHHGPRRLHVPLRSALPWLQGGPRTAAWPQVVPQVLVIYLAFNSTRSHAYQHRLRLQQGRRPRHGSRLQFKPEYHQNHRLLSGYSDLNRHCGCTTFRHQHGLRFWSSVLVSALLSVVNGAQEPWT